MSRLSELLRQVALRDTRLAADLKRETDALAERRSFGLNFERHVPEAVELPGRPVRKNDKVRILPPRGETPTAENEILWRVAVLDRKAGTASLTRSVVEEGEARLEATEAAIDDLVVVAEFRDPIYPGLVSTGKVERGGPDKPYHAVINAENYHALQALLFTHRGKVDAIYIDPPYNTGDKDWKYNNDYVEGDDLYRHSKWLAFMERRLLLARELLNPDDSVLIVTIDEKECLRLGLLLAQVFPEGEIQMVSAVTNRAGTPRAGRFSRVDEYLFYVFIGSGRVVPWTSTMLGDNEISTTMPTVWFTAIRRGSGSAREDKKAGKASFYPVVIDAVTGTFIRVGDPLPLGMPRSDFPLATGEIAIWPLASDGRENRWRFSAEQMRRRFSAGTVRLGRRNPVTGLRPVTYLQPGTIANIENGTFVVTGKTPEGALELALGDVAKRVAPRTVWNRSGHFARDHGSHMISALLPGRRFPFPKALYAVEDTLRFVVADKRDAVVVDFFAGSGTTAHAVMRLNKQDGGRRHTISVTNNEVSAEEQKELQAKALRPGDAEWEGSGICEYVTKPRIRSAITGITPEGRPIKGDYKITDEFPMADGFAESVEFFTLTYEAPLRVSTNREFGKIAPFLWLRAGSRGRRIDDISTGWDVAEAYGVIADLDQSEQFLKAMDEAPSVGHAFIVTDEDRLFEAMVRRLPAHVEPVRLYEAYLRNFEIEAGRAAR